MGKVGKKGRRKKQQQEKNGEQQLPPQPSSTSSTSVSALDMTRRVMQSRELLQREAGKRERKEMAAKKERERRCNPTQNQKLIDKMKCRDNSLEQQQQLIRTLFTNLGINWESYDEYNDGDQSPVTEESDLNEVFYGIMFDFGHSSFVAEQMGVGKKINYEQMAGLSQMLGLDISSEQMSTDMNQFHQCIDSKRPCLSRLAFFCGRPEAQQLDELLRMGGKILVGSTASPPPGPDSEERRLLVERRETTFRLTPTMVAIYSHWHRVSNPGDYSAIVRLLLKHGANPYARDITGRTVVHYATDPHFADPARVTKGLEMAQMCIDASHHYYDKIHKVVTLRGLSKLAALNGSQGYCGGFDTDTGRLVIYLSNEDGTYRAKPIAVKPENVDVNDNSPTSRKSSSSTSNTPLVDIETRHGSTALLKVAYNGECADIASFLIKNGASIDAGNSEGIRKRRTTPRLLATSPLHQMAVQMYSNMEVGRPVDAVIKREIARLDKEAEKNLGGDDRPDLKVCAACKERKKELHECTQCYAVSYCDSNCQRSHWPEHKQECQNSKPVPLGPPRAEELDPGIVATSIRLAEGTLDSDSIGGYNPPDSVAAGEVFWLKITAYSDSFLLCYDDTKRCCFVIYDGAETFKTIINLIRPNYVKPWQRPNVLDNASNDRTCESRHYKAKFTEAGTCMVFPKSERIKRSF